MAKDNKNFDFRGLRCPAPILETSKIMKDLNVGDIAIIMANDPAAKSDFQAWCRRTGNTLVEINEKGNDIELRIRKEH